MRQVTKSIPVPGEIFSFVFYELVYTSAQLGNFMGIDTGNFLLPCMLNLIKFPDNLVQRPQPPPPADTLADPQQNPGHTQPEHQLAPIRLDDLDKIPTLINHHHGDTDFPVCAQHPGDAKAVVKRAIEGIA